MLRVGHDRIRSANGKTSIATYDDVEYDQNGFADCTKYRPIEFDICVIKINNGKTFIGWWDGFQYYSGKLRNMTYKVTHWRKLDHD